MRTWAPSRRAPSVPSLPAPCTSSGPLCRTSAVSQTRRLRVATLPAIRHYPANRRTVPRPRNEIMPPSPPTSAQRSLSSQAKPPGATSSSSRPARPFPSGPTPRQASPSSASSPVGAPSHPGPSLPPSLPVTGPHVESPHPHHPPTLPPQPLRLLDSRRALRVKPGRRLRHPSLRRPKVRMHAAVVKVASSPLVPSPQHPASSRARRLPPLTRSLRSSQAWRPASVLGGRPLPCASVPLHGPRPGPRLPRPRRRPQRRGRRRPQRGDGGARGSCPAGRSRGSKRVRGRVRRQDRLGPLQSAPKQPRSLSLPHGTALRLPSHSPNISAVP